MEWHMPRREGNTMQKLRLNRTLLLDLLFPPRCAVCREVAPVGTALCPECVQRLPQALHAAERCRVCGKPVESCVCREGQPFCFSRAEAAFFYEQDTHYLINCLKTEPQSVAVDQAADLMAGAFLASGLSCTGPFDAVTEVPMSAESEARRGHNQAKTLARRLAARLDIPYLPSPLHCDDRKQAQHTLSYTRRFENVRKSYRRRSGACCAGRILLIDDVMTTGATLNRCAQLLLQCGAGEICCLTAATTLRWGDAAADGDSKEQ